ncbi:MAG: hypothetical protein IPO05_16480 [Flavobacteriales bacterium]|nr:hypothetical protein [Flavobacteriales bacterium]
MQAPCMWWGLNFLPSGFYRLFGKPVNAFNEHFMAPEPLLSGRYEHLRKALEEKRIRPNGAPLHWSHLLR